MYEWSAARPPAQRLSLVNVTPGGEPLPRVSRLSLPTVRGSSSAAERPRGGLYVHDAASGEVAQLDLKEDGSQPSEPGSGWVGASTDASKLFFTFTNR